VQLAVEVQKKRADFLLLRRVRAGAEVRWSGLERRRPLGEMTKRGPGSRLWWSGIPAGRRSCSRASSPCSNQTWLTAARGPRWSPQSSGAGQRVAAGVWQVVLRPVSGLSLEQRPLSGPTLLVPTEPGEGRRLRLALPQAVKASAVREEDFRSIWAWEEPQRPPAWEETLIEMQWEARIWAGSSPTLQDQLWVWEGQPLVWGERPRVWGELQPALGEQ